MNPEEATWLLKLLHNMQYKAYMVPDVGDGDAANQEWKIIIK